MTFGMSIIIFGGASQIVLLQLFSGGASSLVILSFSRSSKFKTFIVWCGFSEYLSTFKIIWKIILSYLN